MVREHPSIASCSEGGQGKEGKYSLWMDVEVLISRILVRLLHNTGIFRTMMISDFDFLSYYIDFRLGSLVADL